MSEDALKGCMCDMAKLTGQRCYVQCEPATVYVLTMCPFCGGPPCVDISQPYPDRPDLNDCWEAHIWCHDCGARGGLAEGTVEVDDEKDGIMIEAIGLWNDRNARAAACYDKGLSSIYFDGSGHARRLADVPA